MESEASATYEPLLTKGDLTETGSSILTITGGTGAVIGSGATIQVAQASAAVSGFLASTDWSLFNNKVSSTSLDTFSELNTFVSDKTLVNEEDAATIDSLWQFQGNASTTQLSAYGGLYVGTTGTTTILGTATSTFGAGIQTTALNQTGTATSTFARGIDLADGCFAIDGVCIGGGSGSGTVNAGLTGRLAFYNADGTTIDDTDFLFWDDTNNYFGVGSTTPGATLAVDGTAWLNTTSINLASTSATTLTVNYLSAATSTIISNSRYAWTLATSTTAKPIISIDTTGSGDEGQATTSIMGGFSVNSGAILYDYGANDTSIERLNLGNIRFEEDAGSVSWINLPITAAADGTRESYSAQIDSLEILTMYGQSNGSGGLKNVRTVIGTSTDAILGSANIPYGSLIVADGILCVDNSEGANCDDAPRSRGSIYSEGASVTEIDLAENYPTRDMALRAGDLVMLDPNNPVFVKKYDPMDSDAVLLGVISTKPGVLLGGFGDAHFTSEKKAPVTLSGRVPVTVSNEAGPIAAGDRIAPSLISGVGMKATTTGMTIGIALEPFNAPTTTQATSSIMIFVNLAYYFSPSDLAFDPLTGFIENGSTTTATTTEGELTSTFAVVLDFFESLGVKIAQGFTRITNLFAGNLTVGTTEKPTGITLYDEATGEPYCIKIINGAFASQAGTCQSLSDEPAPEGEEGELPGGQNTDTQAPVITLVGNEIAEIEVGATYSDPGATVEDNVNDNLGIHVTVDGAEVTQVEIDASLPGEHTIIYSATDQAGNTGTAQRLVVVSIPDSGNSTATTTPEAPADTTAPVITLIGEATISIEEGENYTDAGATAFDETDGDLTNEVTVDNPVDTATPGSYTVVYRVFDTAGNSTEESREVIITQKPQPLVIEESISTTTPQE
jgi:hypothetical protein